VREEVPFLKHAASAFPVLRRKRIGKVEPKGFLNPAPCARQVLKVNVSRLLPADLRPKPSNAETRFSKASPTK